MKVTIQCFVVFLAISVFSACSPKGFMYDGKKADQVTIRDMGEMYSTYNISSSEKEELSRQLKNQSLVDEIVRYSKESTWPSAVNTLDERLSNRSTMMKYHFFKVAKIGNKTIVTIPQSENKHMPAGYVPNGPMYMIFASSVVK